MFALRPWRSFLPGVGSARSPPIKNNDDIPATDTTEIKQLINRVKQGKLHQGDTQLIEKLLNILLANSPNKELMLFIRPNLKSLFSCFLPVTGVNCVFVEG